MTYSINELNSLSLVASADCPLIMIELATAFRLREPQFFSTPFLLMHEDLCPRARPTFLIVPWIRTLLPPRDGLDTVEFSVAQSEVDLRRGI